MSDEQRPTRDELIELLLYAPVGLLYEYRTVLPQLVQRGRSQVQLAKVFGQMAIQNRQQAARQKIDQQVDGLRCGDSEGGSDPSDPLGLLALALARGITEFGATLGLAPDRNTSDPVGESLGGVDEAGREPTDHTESPADTSAEEGDLPLPIAGYDELPAREIITLLGDLDAEQRSRIRDHESSNRARKTVLAKLDRLDQPS